MKKMYYENLPKTKFGSIQWNKTVGYPVNFIFDDIHGEVIIKQYIPNGKHPKIIIQYENKIKEIDVEVFKRCSIQKLIGKPSSSFFYDIDNEIGGLKIIDREYRDTIRSKNEKEYINKAKFYKCRCIACKHEHYKEESILKRGIGCPVCNGKAIKQGINDIATTHPNMVRFFKYKEDTLKYTYSSGKKVFTTCPLCKNEKYMRIADIFRHDMSCMCGDGFSYPEKFIYNLLFQLNVSFKTQYSPNWANNKRYDFYLNDYNLILEVHGEQHYTHSFIGCSGDSLDEVIRNDSFKKKMAQDNGIKKYIGLDCSKSSLKFIKKSIYNSYLSEILLLDNVEWKQCNEYACKNIIYQVCELWNEYNTTTKIKDELQISRTTIIKYLKLGFEMNLCNYNANSARNKGLIMGRKQCK